MCVSTINGETNNHMIQEKEPARKQAIFAMDDSDVILKANIKMGVPFAFFHSTLTLISFAFAST